ncbi:MAG: hypothetical protein FJX75_29125, partial [Armatimonadetes bacterium]|nr:hypothetical protein [Armatimonadota bacterium]
MRSSTHCLVDRCRLTSCQIRRLVSLSFAVLAVAFLLAAPPLLAAVITVDDDGPADFSTIQAAMDAAADGDTIQVAAGTYREIPRVSGKSLTLIGDGPATTIIDGDGVVDPPEYAHVGVLVYSAAQVHIEGFRVIHAGRRDSALFIGHVGQVALVNCVIEGNHYPLAEGGGGAAMWLPHGNPGVVVRNCTFLGNAATVPGGGLRIAGHWMDRTTALIEG